MQTQFSHTLSARTAYRLFLALGLATALLAVFACGLNSNANAVSAAGDVLVVNSTDDGIDIHPGDGLCETSSGTCTLRAAIMESNAGTDITHTIAFGLSGGGPFTIAPQSALPEITHPVVIDGLTQPGASCDDWPPALLIELDGTNVPATFIPPTPPIGLSLAAGNSVVRGLVINRFSKLLLGSNYGTGLAVNRSDNNLMTCNFVGTEPDGETRAPNEFGISLGNASHNVMTRNLVSGNADNGIVISVDPDGGGESDGNRITANFIGTDKTGKLALGNGGDGVLLINARNTIVAENLISGNGDDGVDVTDTVAGLVESCTTPPCATGNQVVDNLIGSAAGGAFSLDLGNGDNGVEFKSAENNLVADNLIVASGVHGVQIDELGSCTKGTLPCAISNTIRANSIYSNAGLGIDLKDAADGSDGVTANDAGDGDVGANNLQNFPVLDSARIVDRELVISSTIDSTANGVFTLDFYANPTCDPSGYGEGRTWLISRTVSAGSGASFAITTTVPLDRFITATATDNDGNSSEFSACVEVSGTPPTWTLTLAIDGKGSGSVEPAAGQHVYTMGTVVILTATAGSGSVFGGWNGSLISTANPAAVIVAQDMAITATFDLANTVYLPLVVDAD